MIPHLVTGQALDDVAALYRLTRRPGETDRKLQRRVWFETYEGSEPYVVFVEPVSVSNRRRDAFTEGDSTSISGEKQPLKSDGRYFWVKAVEPEDPREAVAGPSRWAHL